jgi:hypothetical protein
VKLHLDDNDFDNILREFQKIDTLEFVSLNDNVIDSKLPFEIDEYLSLLERRLIAVVYLGLLLLKPYR